ALRRLAALHAAAGRWDDAAVGFHRLVSLEQGAARADAAVALADACAAAGRPTDARDGLQRAYEADLGNAVLRDRLRQLYEALGHFHEAAKLWTDAAERSADEGERFEAFRRAGEVMLDNAAEPALAIDPLERAHALRPADHDVTVLLVDAFTASQRLEDASGLLNTAIAAHKNRRSKELATLQHRMGRLAYAAGDHAVEMAWLNAALDTDPQNGQVAAELADVAMEQANFDIAQKALRAIALMKNPAPMSRAMAFLRQGMIARSQGDAKKAVFLARKALSEDANLEEARAFLREIGAE
ncbi:MAG: tetratricopeptide repeat protein, partial [Deltaproteobacteria bacterium]|nr:tetratricopeptide repeat protein [Deltaproteobacteria bacterium]